MLGLADALEHLAERQAQQYGDHGPDEETARDPQDPHISSKTPGRRVVAARSRLAWMWGRVPVDHPGEREAACHACGDGSVSSADCLIDQDTAQPMKT